MSLFEESIPHGEEEAAAIADQNRRASSNGQGPDQEAADADLLAGIRDGAWLDRQDFPPLRYAVPDLIPEGFTLLVGPPKIGKSWLMAGILLGCGAGGHALGKLPLGKPRHVLYLAMEDSDRRMQDRCRKLMGTDEPIPPMFHYLTKVEPSKVLATIAAFLRLHPETVLVVVDTLGKVMPTALPGESAYQRDYRVGGALQQLALDHPGLAVVVNHHDRKAFSDDFIDSVSGTHGLAGAADSVFVLTRHRNETAGLLKVTGRDIPEGEYALVFADGHRWQLDGENLARAAERAKETRAEVRATAGVSDRMAEVIGHVLKHPQGVTAAEVAKALGMEPKTAGTYLGRAADGGRLRKLSRGLYAPVESVGSVESEDSGPPEYNTPNTFNTPSGERLAGTAGTARIGADHVPPRSSGTDEALARDGTQSNPLRAVPESGRLWSCPKCGHQTTTTANDMTGLPCLNRAGGCTGRYEAAA